VGISLIKGQKRSAYRKGLIGAQPSRVYVVAYEFVVTKVEEI
jgi:hypothetical protein